MRVLYVQSKPEAGGLLQLSVGKHTYALSILHATLDEPRPYKRSQTQHAHDVYHLLCYTRGGGRILLGQRRLPVRRGTLLLVAPQQVHDFGPCEPALLHYNEVTFELRSGAECLAVPFHQLLGLYAGCALTETPGSIDLDERQFREISDLYDTLLTRLRAAQTHAFFARAALLELLGFLMREVYKAGEQGKPATPLALAHELIEQRYAQPLWLPELAGQASLSVGYFCRAFKRQFGVSPMQYQQQLRISAAKSLLRTTALSCKEIAARTGFCDLYSFSKAFKRATGVSPKRFM